MITDFLQTVRGLNDSAVTQQLANLKASHDYARIINEVREEIEQRNADRSRPDQKLIGDSGSFLSVPASTPRSALSLPHGREQISTAHHHHSSSPVKPARE